MSLLNVWVSHAKAMVVVDTEVRTQDGTYHEASKMMVLPHANAVVAVRGHNVFLSSVASLVLQTGGDFDQIVENMPLHLKTAMDFLVSNKEQFVDSVYRQEIALVGYSRSLGCMDCMVYASADETGFKDTEIDKAYLSPWDGSWGDALDVFTVPHRATMFCTDQVSNALAMHPDQPFGGRLLLAELTRDDVRISTLSTVTGRALA